MRGFFGFSLRVRCDLDISSRDPTDNRYTTNLDLDFVGASCLCFVIAEI